MGVRLCPGNLLLECEDEIMEIKKIKNCKEVAIGLQRNAETGVKRNDNGTKIIRK